MKHPIEITVSSTPPFEYYGREFEPVRKKHELQWKCTNATAAIIFSGASPFVTGEKIIILPLNTWSKLLTIRPPKNNQIEVLKYCVVAYFDGQIVVHDPIIIIDNDGGGGGSVKKKVAKKKAAKKKTAKK